MEIIKRINQYTNNVIVQEASVTTYDGKEHTLKKITAGDFPDIRKIILVKILL